MLALQTVWLLWSGPTLESRFDKSDKDKEEKADRRMQVKSRIWLAVSEAALKPEAFLLPEFRHLFKVHLTLFLTRRVVTDLIFFGNYPVVTGLLLHGAIGTVRRFQQWERCLLGIRSEQPPKRFLLIRWRSYWWWSWNVVIVDMNWQWHWRTSGDWGRHRVVASFPGLASRMLPSNSIQGIQQVVLNNHLLRCKFS